ncbi:MAG: molybdenum cofactor biosynthesis protein MoaE [Thermodesulfobacteriota bacterium]|nr:molybdenum cofactor biosynthesis protein MoaE [Thermodesulfobacteriota bacterium]
MNISKTIAALKNEPGFKENVGMVLVHNGVVRGFARDDGAEVKTLEVTPDYGMIEDVCREYSKRPGIFRVLAEAASGVFEPGDDLLFIIVAGDVRENVKSVFAEVLDRIKSEALKKKEVTV